MDGVAVREERVELRITILGRVQGVGYRWYVREAATRFGVTGWTSNLPDGSVRIEAGGLRAAIDAFIAALRQGPPHAHVMDVRVEARPAADPLPEHFTIQR